jgi:PAS domain S-box-containing protein
VGRSVNSPEKKWLEDKLRILSQAVEQNPASTIITDSTGNIEFVNNAFTKLTQYEMVEVMNKTPRIFNRGHIPSENFDSMWEMLKNGKVWKGEYQNRRKDKSAYWENVTISSLMNSQGEISNFILIMDDISEKKKMLDDLITAKESAEESNRLKSAFLAMMNHELRTPLTHILGFSELIMSGVAPEDNISFASSIQNSGQSLLSIIEGVFDLALVEQAKIKLNYQTFSLMDHFMENKASFDNILRNSAKQEQIQLTFSPDSHWLSSYVTADRSKINQILTNLFKNAVKFTNEGTIEFGYKVENESRLMFYIKDTGIGIPQEKQSVIFDFFRQGDDSNTRVYGGIGIGLSISNKIAKLLKGELKVVSEPGVGSIFSLTLPVELLYIKE